MLSDFFLRSFRILLLPFALIYWFIIFIRNWFYDKKILGSTSFGLPVKCVGNLSVGGTGKSPMVEYLLEILKDKFKVATLSRGYKRKTKGYALATIDDLPKVIFEKQLLNPKGWFVLEHTPGNNYKKLPFYVTERNYGTTIFSIFIQP